MFSEVLGVKGCPLCTCQVRGSLQLVLSEHASLSLFSAGSHDVLQPLASPLLSEEVTIATETHEIGWFGQQGYKLH